MDRETLKKWFQRGKKPTESQFAELIDSFRHVDEKLKVSDVENLAGLIGGKMERTEAIEEFASQSAAIEQLSEEKTSAEDVQKMMEEYHATQEWTSESNLNDYTETGIYHFAGYRTNANDNLPIDNADAKANIAFTLIVDKSEGYLEGTTHVPTIVSQTLFLGNRQGSETKAYVRNCTIFFDGQSDKWESWRELMQTTYLGELNSYDDLNTTTEIGLYTGAMITLASNVADVFKLEVINNYAVTTQVSAATGSSVPNSVLQTITILNLDGNNATKKRIGTYNGSGYTWTEWESQSFEVPTATQTTLGVVKGSSTVEVREDGSLQVNSDRLETAIADKLGAVRQGRNTLIDANGAINVDGISNTDIDTDFSDGEINDIRVQIEPTKTIEELRYERADVYDKGYSGFEAINENIPNPYPSGNDIQLIGRTDESGTRLDSSIYYEPNPSSFVEKEGLDYSSWSVTTDSFRNIWGTAANMARSRIDALKKEGYGNENHGTTVDLRSGFGLYPYLGGRFVFVIKENLKSGCATYHYLYNAKDELLGEFKYEAGKGEVLTIKSPRADGANYGYEDYLPLRIKTEFYKSEVAPTSGDFNLTLEIYTEEITNGLNDWSSPIINDRGRTFLLFAEKYIEFPTTLKTADLTRCLSIGKDGILFQSAVKSGTGNSVTTTEKELYIKFDEEKGIITNIGDFING